jgi:hypothetical protein
MSSANPTARPAQSARGGVRGDFVDFGNQCAMAASDRHFRNSFSDASCRTGDDENPAGSVCCGHFQILVSCPSRLSHYDSNLSVP